MAAINIIADLFLSSSLLSRLFRGRKLLLDEKFSKGSERDAWQVLANGGIAGGFVLLGLFLPDAAWTWAGCAAALAAANADTWGTELGVLSPRQPRLITNFKPVSPGTSGGISLTGIVAGLLGASLVALPGALFWQPAISLSFTSRFGLLALAGLIGSLIDSILGATIQAIYTCPACRKETERHPLHICGEKTIRKRGIPWLNNDWVNTACTFSGALIAVVIFSLFPTSMTQPIVLTGVPMNKLSFSSPAFKNTAQIPAKYTCDGENLSPELIWSDLPDGTRSLALIVDDPDSYPPGFTHWVIYNLPSTLFGLPEGMEQASRVRGFGSQGRNDFGNHGYDGPCPPGGKIHHYYFTLHALDLESNLPDGLSKQKLLKLIQGHILGQVEWMGTYRR